MTVFKCIIAASSLRELFGPPQKFKFFLFPFQLHLKMQTIIVSQIPVFHPGLTPAKAALVTSTRWVRDLHAFIRLSTSSSTRITQITRTVSAALTLGRNLL